MKKKIALITGVTGQDGAYLARFLLSKNYMFTALRRSSSLNTSRIDEIYNDPNETKTNFFTLWGYGRSYSFDKNHTKNQTR